MNWQQWEAKWEANPQWLWYIVLAGPVLAVLLHICDARLLPGDVSSNLFEHEMSTGQ